MRLAAVAVLLVAASCTEVPRNVGGAAPTRTVTPTRTAEPTRSLPPPTQPPTPSATPTPSAATSRPASPTPAASPSPAASASPSPARTASPTPSRTPSSTAGLPPQPPEPTLPPGATVALTGEQRFTIAAGGRRAFDPVVLARDAGRTAPPCTSLVWTSAWHAAEPLRAAWLHDGASNDLGAGRWGTSSLGCSALELRNEGSASVEARIVFTIASR